MLHLNPLLSLHSSVFLLNLFKQAKAKEKESQAMSLTVDVPGWTIPHLPPHSGVGPVILPEYTTIHITKDAYYPQHVEITDNQPHGFHLYVTLTADSDNDLTYKVLRKPYTVSYEVKISHTPLPLTVIRPSKLRLVKLSTIVQETQSVLSEDSTDNDYNDCIVAFSYRVKPHRVLPPPK
jgi:hypothetical protein